MPMLATVKLGRKSYFVDERLCQLRNVNDPFDWMDFASVHEMWGYIDSRSKKHRAQKGA